MRSKYSLSFALCVLALCGGEAVPAVSSPQPEAPGEPQVVRGGALDSDCTHAGQYGGGYQFIVTCPGKAWSPDRHWAVVAKSGEESGAQLRDSNDRIVDDLTVLWDDMPFVVYWSPKSSWFFVNHYLGSSQDRLRVFEIVNRTAIERSAIFAEATKIAVARYPCLAHHASIVASGWQWSRDGRRIAMVVYARPDACHVERSPGEWRPLGAWQTLWMIGDVETGRIDPESVRVRPDGVGPMPTDGPYARL